MLGKQWVHWGERGRWAWRYLVVLLAAFGLVLVVGQVSASKLPASHGSGTGRGDTPATGDAFLELVPGTGGTVPAPVNGGAVPLGGRFVLDLMLHSGSREDITAQQSYITFTNSILQNVRVANIASACIVTSTVTGDLDAFDVQIQNETCNGPANCNFRGLDIMPGWMAYVSGAMT